MTARVSGMPRELGPHATTEEIAAYLDGGLSADDVRRLDAHLADCGVCREELVETRRLLAVPRPGRRSPLGIRGAAAALVAAALASILLLPGDPPADPARLRADADPEDSRAILFVEPADGAVVPARGASFVWRASGPEVAYRFSLADEAGAAIWSASTSDTSLALPPEVALVPGQTYLWRVDGLFADGRSVSTSVQRVTVLQ